jgi:hypothetical protein
MKGTLRRKLRSLWLGELVVALLLIISYGLLRLIGNRQLGDYSLLALVILSVVILQGSIYWQLKLRQLDKASPSFDPRIVQYTYAFDLPLLLIFPMAIFVALLNGTIESSLSDVVIGGGIYLIALIAFIHHFLVKLVRSDSDRSALTRRRQVTARWMRELQRNERRKETV